MAQKTTEKSPTPPVSPTTASSNSEIISRLIKMPKAWRNDPSRKILQQGICFIEEDKKVKPRWCLLFNDSFLVTKPQCEFIDNDTNLSDEKTKLKYKNLLYLNKCHIEESPNLVNAIARLQHETRPFVFVGENPVNNKAISLPLSCKNIHDRENWIKKSHRAILKIHEKTHNDFERYAWVNQYRRGTIFHALYSHNNKLLNSIINELNNEIQSQNELKSSDDDDNDNNNKKPRRKQSQNIQNRIESLIDAGGHNLLHIAACKNMAEFIRDYGSKFNVDLPDQNGWTALRLACDNNSFESIKELIKLNANLEECYPEDKKSNPYIRQNFDDRSFLHEFSKQGNIEIVKLLLNANVNLESLDSKGMTPLHIASKENQESIVLILLRHGAPPNVGDYTHNRPLHLTTKIQIARWLIVYGARLDLPNKQGFPASTIWENKLESYDKILKTLSADECNRLSEPIDEHGWFDDKLSEACLGCQCKFTMTNRRHHCRHCGLLVCNACSARKCNFTKDGKPTLMRVCDKCYNVAHTEYNKVKTYQHNGKNLSMRPCDYLCMVTMNTTKPNSYTPNIHSYNAVTKGSNNNNNNNNAMGSDYVDDEKKQSSSVPSSSHVSVKSDSSIFKNRNKNKNKNQNKSKHVPSKTVVVKSTTNDARDLVNQANVKAMERGEKLNELAIKSDQLADNAKNFNSLAKQLAKKKW